MRRSELRQYVSTLPRETGVYLFRDEQGRIIYVGKAKSLRDRVQQYFSTESDGREQFPHLVRRIADVEVIVTDTELEALILESNLVRANKPRYNIDLRDDKSFPFLRITQEPFPRVFLTRHPVDDGSKYLGPFRELHQLRGLLTLLRGMLKIRSCNLPLTPMGIKQGKFKACLEYHIGRCNAPCIALESQDEYLNHIRDFSKIASGKGAEVVRRLQEELNQLSEDQRYEEAARLRDWLAALENLRSRQKVISALPISRDVFGLALEDDVGVLVVFQVREGKLSERLDYRLTQIAHLQPAEVLQSSLIRYYSRPVSMPDEVFLPLELDDIDLFRSWLKKRSGTKIDVRVPAKGEKASLVNLAVRNAELVLGQYQRATHNRERIPLSLFELQKQLGLPIPPRRIVAFDISNLQATNTVASMVVFENGRAARSQYRRYRIRTVRGQDDFASIGEAVGRYVTRLQRESKPLPDLILIDGGKGQLSAAHRVLADLGVVSPTMVGLAKRLDEVYRLDDPLPLNLPRSSSALRLLQQVRDEAHRFALEYHRLLRGKRALHSRLDEIGGIGPVRRKALLERFGSLKRMAEVPLEELLAVKGMNQSVALRVHAFLQHLRESSTK